MGKKEGGISIKEIMRKVYIKRNLSCPSPMQNFGRV